MADTFDPNDPKLTYHGMLAIDWVETGIAGLFIGARIILRWLEKERSLFKPTFDDLFSYFAFGCMCASSVIYIAITPAMFILSELEEGHIKALPPKLQAYMTFFLKWQFVAIVLFWTIIWSVKCSFLAFYHQLFSRQFQGWQKYAWWVAVVLTVVTYWANFILQFFVCVPLKSYFKLGGCNTPRDIHVSNDSLYFATATDIFTDLLIMALPLSILFSLHMNTRTKVALGGLFLTGFIIVLFAILRLVYTIPSDEHVNPKWLEIWSSTEACIAVSVSCAPPFRKYFISRARTASTQRHSTSSQSAAGPSNSLPVRPEELDVEEK